MNDSNQLKGGSCVDKDQIHYCPVVVQKFDANTFKGNVSSYAHKQGKK